MASQQNTSRHPIAFRILHEVIIVSVILLIITGFYIHRPFVGGAGFLMSMMRGVHFFFAAVLIIAVIIRLISMFVGKDRDWSSFIPTWSDIVLLPRMLAYYLHLGKEPVVTKKYNPLQMFSYCFAFILIIFQILTGFALNYPDGAMSWMSYGMFNNEIAVRIAHFIATWILVIFVMFHVYMAIRENFSEIKQMHLLKDED